MSYACGTISAYIHRGCRCEDCRRAKSEYQRAWLRDEPRIVDVSALRPGLLALYRRGLSIGQLARRAGTRSQTLSAILVGRRSFARRALAERLEAVLVKETQRGKLEA